MVETGAGKSFRYRKDQNIITREIANETILVPICWNVGDLDSVYTLNSTASFIWGLLDGIKSIGEICDLVVKKYHIDSQEAQSDLEELVRALEALRFVECAEQP